MTLGDAFAVGGGGYGWGVGFKGDVLAVELRAEAFCCFSGGFYEVGLVALEPEGPLFDAGKAGEVADEALEAVGPPPTHGTTPRLIGLSRAGTGGYGRGLCTDADGRDLWQPGAPHTVVTSEPSPLPSGDWASGCRTVS
ncbi:hypothetical protein ACQEVX_00035 [Streptomyces syringium]|uniref:hypothetical protein n=1 Tax=Streptomyces syringium TaxID=76729 RepID=UPI003D90A0C0